MKSKEQVEMEIKKKETFLSRVKPNSGIGYFDGWIDALKWILEDGNDVSIIPFIKNRIADMMQFYDFYSMDEWINYRNNYYIKIVEDILRMEVYEK